MARKKQSKDKSSMRTVATLWTIVAVGCAINLVMFPDGLTALTLLFSLAVCLVHWYRYANYEKNNKETTQ